MMFRISISNVSVQFCEFRMKQGTLGGRSLNAYSMRESHMRYQAGRSMNPYAR